MFRIMREEPDFSAMPRTAYSPGFERIVSRALAKAPAERYQTLEEMRDDLERLVRDTAGRLRAPDPDEERRQARRREDVSALVRAVEQARADGHLQKALTACRRLLELDPDDPVGRRLAAEVEQAIREKEIEELAGMALAYAADGDLEFAKRIAAKVERVAPGNAKHRELADYLDEEAARREASALVATAQEHIVLGNLEEARAAAEAVLAAQPGHALAREIRDRASSVLVRREPSPTPVSLAVATPLPAAASLLDAALAHFVRSDHAQARAAVEKVLAIDPGNRKARELQTILGALR